MKMHDHKLAIGSYSIHIYYQNRIDPDQTASTGGGVVEKENYFGENDQTFFSPKKRKCTLIIFKIVHNLQTLISP